MCDGILPRLVFASILRIRSALKLVEVKYSTDADFLDQLRIETGLFESLIEAEQSIRPLVLASMLMQRDSNTLADVVNMFGILYQSFKPLRNADHSRLVIDTLEKRWKQQEQPCLFLCWMLHPKYMKSFREIALSGMITNLSSGCMIEYAIFYYKKLIGDDYGDLGTQVNNIYFNKYHRAAIFKGMDPLDFWVAMRNSSTDKLCELAIRMISLEPQSATCERLFSAFGNFKSKKRNRLSSTKMHYLAQVKRNVQVMDEIECQVSYGEKKNRILNPDERPKICSGQQTETESTAVDLVDSESDSKHDICTNVPDAENDSDEFEDTFDLTSEWMLALEFDDDDYFYEESQTAISNEDYSADVIQLQHSDGAEFRQANPYPDWNDPSVKQDKLRGLRNRKVSLFDMFDSNDIELP